MRRLAVTLTAWALLLAGCGGSAVGTGTQVANARNPRPGDSGPARAATAPAVRTAPAPSTGRGRPAPRTPHPVHQNGRPNIVFVLTDDLSMDLLAYMPHVQLMRRQGLTFSQYFVSDSLCCPSRSSIFTGNFPHDTGVFSNTGPDGGFHIFHRRGEENRTFAVALRQAGYRTAMMGKYLNGYMGSRAHAGDGLPGPDVPRTYVPPGWSEWDVAGFGYPEFDYTLNQNGTLRHYGTAPRDYMTDVLGRLGQRFIDRSVRARSPFFLEMATFAPHGPYIPAPRDVGTFPNLVAPRPPSFNVLPSSPPAWLAQHQPLSDAQIEEIDTVFRHRVQQVQAVDRVIGRVQAQLRALHVSRNTYIVFSSDNGLHLGQHRLQPGKLTAYDTDIHVPLVVLGPGVPAGTTTNLLAENIDLARTFTGLAGTSIPCDGHSLVPLLRGRTPAGWRNAALVEHHGSDLQGADPDFQVSGAGAPRTYEAMRTAGMLYVEYNDGERELYDLNADPFELRNLAPATAPQRLAALHAELARMERCHSGSGCWAASHVGVATAG